MSVNGIIRELEIRLPNIICTTKEAIDELNIKIATVQKWYQDGYLSFKIEEEQLNKPIDEHCFNELSFINSIFNSDFSLDVINTLLSKLDKPYSYSLSKIYYDFKTNDWEFFPNEINNLKDLVDEIDYIIEYSDKKDINEDFLDNAKSIIAKLQHYTGEYKEKGLIY